MVRNQAHFVILIETLELPNPILIVQLIPIFRMNEARCSHEQLNYVGIVQVQCPLSIVGSNESNHRTKKPKQHNVHGFESDVYNEPKRQKYNTTI